MKNPVPISPWRAITWLGREVDLDGDRRRRPRGSAGIDAREQRAAAEQLCAAVRGQGHAVLLGSAGLPMRAPHGGAPSMRRRAASWGSVCKDAGCGAGTPRSAADRRRWRGHARGDRGHSRRVALFGDLQTPQLLGVAGPFEEVVLPAGRAHPPPGPDRLRLLRDPRRRRGRHDRRARSAPTLARGDFFGEVIVLLGEPPTADIVAVTPLRCLAMPARAVEPFLVDLPAGHVPDAPGPGPAPPQREPLAELAAVASTRVRRSARSRRASTRSSSSAPARAASRPRTSSRRYGIEHAVISADPAAGRHVPQLAVLPAAAVVDQALRARGAGVARVRALGLEQPPRPRAGAARRSQTEFMDGSSDFPSRPEMQANLEAFAERAGIARPLRLPLGVDPARGDGPTATGSSSTTSDGEYRCRLLVFAVGVAEPYSPSPPGIELAVHYADTRDAATYAGKRLFIIGKQNSGFELASGLAPWASPIALSLAVAGEDLDRDALARRRPGALRPAVRGLVLGWRRRHPRRVDRQGHRAARRRARSGSTSSAATTRCRCASRPTRSSPRPASPARCATCPTSASTTFGQSKLPAQTPSSGRARPCPGIFFAGTITQGSPGLKKHGIPSNSGAVHGHRYNGRVLARDIAETHFGIALERPARRRRRSAPYLLRRGDPRARAVAPEGVPGRASSASTRRRRPRRGHPAADARPRRDDPGRVAMTVEADGTGDLSGRLRAPRRAAGGARARGRPAAGLRERRPTSRAFAARSRACSTRHPRPDHGDVVVGGRTDVGE